MKLNEIKDMYDDEPMLITLMRQRLEKGERIARYYRSGDSVKPMWIKSIERLNKSTSGGEEYIEWLFRCNKGNSIDYLNYDDEDFDEKFELLPGKTKGTWQFRRRAIMPPVALRGIFREGRGEELMSYSDFAEKAYTKAKTRSMYDTLAAELFRRGFSFSISPKGTAGRFKKEINGEGVQLSITGNSAPTHSSRRTVIVSITGHDPGTGEPRGKHQSYEIDDMIDSGADLDFILSGQDH